MTAEASTRWIIGAIGLIVTINLAATGMNVRYTAQVEARWIETETTQEGVLATLDALESEGHRLDREMIAFKEEHHLMQRDIQLFPNQVDDGDRWTETEQKLYQKSQEIIHIDIERRLGNLEIIHQRGH